MVSAPVAARVGPLVPLDAEAAIDAIFSNGLATIVEFFLLLGATVLIIGAMALLVGAGISKLSIDSGGQRQTADYFISAIIVLVIALIVASAPEVFSALGFTPAERFSVVDIFSG
jgi:hypothetical protein